MDLTLWPLLSTADFTNQSEQACASDCSLSLCLSPMLPGLRFFFVVALAGLWSDCKLVQVLVFVELTLALEVGTENA